MIEELARAEAATRSCVDAAVWVMPEPHLVEALEAVHRLEQRLATLKLALVREVDGRGIAVSQGASSTAVWLRDRLRLTVRSARRLVDLAAALDAESAGPSPSGTGPSTVVRAALADGRVNVEQAQLVIETAATVQAEAGAEAADAAVALLLEWAAQFDAVPLRRLAGRILDHVAPEVAEAAAQRALEAEAARAARDRHITLAQTSDGRLRLTGNLDVETAALLRAALDPLTAPAGSEDTRTPGQRRHDALADICRLALRTGELPDHGGDPAQLVVTASYDTLKRQLSAGTLDNGMTLPAETVRRLGCDAALLPAVLDTSGQVLDLGRQRRLITGPLRRALVLRDRGCAFPGCDRPPRWCEGHHLRHWSQGGATSLANAVLLCRHHHRQVHHHGWQVRLAPDGHPEFLPPAWVDPRQRPRRNHHHHIRPPGRSLTAPPGRAGRPASTGPPRRPSARAQSTVTCSAAPTVVG